LLAFHINNAVLLVCMGNIYFVSSCQFIIVHLLQRKPVFFSRLRSMEAVNAALTHLTASPRATKDASSAPNVLTNFPDVLFLFVAGINFPAPQTEI